MRKLFLACNFLALFYINAQEKFSKSITLQSDNDLYVSYYNDKYYTNGIFIRYQYLTKNNSAKLHKKITEWQIGHEMYTPFVSILSNPNLHDRPFAAHLFGTYSINRVYKNDQNLKTTFQIGVIGKNAFGQQIQNFVHDIYGFKRPQGWEFQIQDALSLNFNANYVKLLTSEENNSIDFSFIADARVGTIYTDLSVGFLSRTSFRALASIHNSVLFGTNLNDNNSSLNNQKEAFFFMKPMLHYALYDATIQGSFLNQSSPVTKELVNFRLGIDLGLVFTFNRFNFSYAVNFHTKKIENLRSSIGNNYGKIILQYMMN